MLTWIRRLGRRPDGGADADSAASAVGEQLSGADWKARGNVLLEQDQFDEAAECYRRAVERNPADAAGWTNLGFALTEGGRLVEAEPALRRAVAADARSHDALYLLGMVLQRIGRPVDADAAYEAALRLEPGFVVCRRDLFWLCMKLRQLERARALAEAGVRLHPEHADFHYCLGTVLHEYREFDAARTALERALVLHPEFAHAHNNLGNTLLALGQMDRAVASYRTALALDPTYVDAHSNLLFALNYHPDLSPQQIFSAYRDYDAALGQPLRDSWSDHANDRSAQRRLRIGYLSPDYHQHSIRHFLEPLLAHHDKAVVEVYAYAEVGTEDATTARYRCHADHWIPTQNLSDDALARRIRDDRIDVLVDLAGHTARNRLGVMARKPAPVSVSWLGYGYTTGLTAVDYLLTDDVGTPPGSEHLFAERPWRLATPGYAFRPADGMGPVNASPALERGHVTFGSLTRSVRINHRSIRVWSAILDRVPGARLVLNSLSFDDAPSRARMVEKFAASGISPGRLEIGFRSPPWDVLRGIDIGLDCFPHNSGTTLFETLYMGIPFVTLTGRPSVGTLGSSILQGIGHTEWIARTEGEYVEIAVRLASDLPALAALRERLRGEMESSPLRDEVGFARKAEAAYREMFTRWATGHVRAHAGPDRISE